MTEENLIKALDGDKSYKEEIIEFLKKVVDDFFDKYTKKFPGLENAREHALGDAGSYILMQLPKLERLWKGKNNHDRIARTMIKYYYFSGTPQSKIDRWKSKNIK